MKTRRTDPTGIPPRRGASRRCSAAHGAVGPPRTLRPWMQHKKEPVLSREHREGLARHGRGRNLADILESQARAETDLEREPSPCTQTNRLAERCDLRFLKGLVSEGLLLSFRRAASLRVDERVPRDPLQRVRRKTKKNRDGPSDRLREGRGLAELLLQRLGVGRPDSSDEEGARHRLDVLDVPRYSDLPFSKPAQLGAPGEDPDPHKSRA